MKRLLQSMNSPADLKGLSLDDYGRLADELRNEICNVVSRNGGHLAPSLGVVELTIALHAVYDCPDDRIVWDVGHQAYAHKILTGRRDRFPTIRTEGGLSGFPSIFESEYDAFGVGHAGTAISAALGLACARDQRGTSEKVIAVVGDGAMTCGLSFEGLNNAGASKRDLLVILNDNKMSISPNVGALSKYLTDVISAKPYNRVKRDIMELVGFIPRVGQPVTTVINRLEHSLKSIIVPGAWFESLGFRYIGLVDGHDMGRLIQVLSQVKDMKGPILLHVYTTKGKGYCFAEQDATRFHGVAAFRKETGQSMKESDRPSYSRVFGDTLVELARNDERICAVTAAMTDSTGLGAFAREFPERFHDVGIAEGHAVTFACGLARGGSKPFVAIYSSFLQRAYDGIIHDAALQKLPVVICLDRAGFVGEDGPTHHGVFDIAFLRHIPGLVVMAPKDENDLRQMLAFAAGYDTGPVAIRYPRGSGTAEEMTDDIPPVEHGRAEVVREGGDAVILAVGETVPEALVAADSLDGEGIGVMVVNMRFVSPLDSGLLDRVAAMGVPVVTVEDGIIAGGFGASVLEYFSLHGGMPRVTMVGIPREFSPHASRRRLLERYGLDARSLAHTVRDMVDR